MPAPVAPRASRLLLDLAAAVEATRDVHEADCLRADLAAQLVRSGHDAEGEAMLAELRARYRATPHERVTPWLNFAESTVDLQNGRGEEALIKMRRAHALSQAIGLPLTALAAASLASMYWNLQDADKAVGYASEALRVAVENDHRARCRASAVVAEILGMSRREADAGRWFVRARMHASLSGDHTALSVIGFNAAQTRLVVERQLALRNANTAASTAIGKIQASRNYDELFSISASDFTKLQTAQLFALVGKDSEAIELFEQLLAAAKLSSALRQRPSWLSELAWCYARCSLLDMALATADLARHFSLASLQLDDRAATHSRLGHVYEMLGDHEKSRLHFEAAAPLWSQYEAFQDRCGHLVDTLVPPLES